MPYKLGFRYCMFQCRHNRCCYYSFNTVATYNSCSRQDESFRRIRYNVHEDADVKFSVANTRTMRCREQESNPQVPVYWYRIWPSHCLPVTKRQTSISSYVVRRARTWPSLLEDSLTSRRSPDTDEKREKTQQCWHSCSSVRTAHWQDCQEYKPIETLILLMTFRLILKVISTNFHYIPHTGAKMYYWCFYKVYYIADSIHAAAAAAAAAES